MDLTRVQHVHFIGIGGIGLSALARMMLLEGKRVSGSDVSGSLVTGVLADLGAEIFDGHRAEHISESVDLVIYTIAVPLDNPELREARARNIPLLTYPEALGELSKDKYTIAVSGTHGKTTTTGMIAQIMLEAGYDPSVVIGSFLKGYKSNFIAGKSRYLVAESCEYRRSFLHIHPNILVITNIAEEHLDYYHDLADIQEAFKALVKRIPEDGYLVCNPKDPAVMPVVAEAFCNVIDYTMEKIYFDLQVPGEHNKENAKAAFAATEAVGISRTQSAGSIERFTGTWRRADRLGETKKGAIVFDDYAHHPDEVETTLRGFKERFPDRYLVVVFQPHLYSRTKRFLERFADALTLADEVIVMPIYAAREPADPAIRGEMLAALVEERGSKCTFLDDFFEIGQYLSKRFERDTLIVTMGAGDVYKIGEQLVAWEK